MTYVDKQDKIHLIKHVSMAPSPPNFFNCVTEEGLTLLLYRADITCCHGEAFPEKPSPDIFADVIRFHQKRGQVYDGPPRNLPLAESLERISRKIEEFAEMLKAYCKDDREEILDGLIDLVYYSVGTCYLHGFNFDEAWRRVQAANMAKNRPEPGNSSKPPGWEPPNLKDLV